MKKKLLSALLIAGMMCGLMFHTSAYEVNAEENMTYEEDDVTTESSSTGIANCLTRGIYLKSGSSSISDAGNSKITASGDTVAQKMVNKISVGVKVQRKVNGNWAIYTTWSASNTNSIYVNSTKTFSVPSGYYYRVYCIHAADSDGSQSSTSGIWID